MFLIVKREYGSADEYIGPFKNDQTAHNFLEKKLPRLGYDYDSEYYFTDNHIYEVIKMRSPSQKGRIE